MNKEGWKLPKKVLWLVFGSHSWSKYTTDIVLKSFPLKIKTFKLHLNFKLFDIRAKRRYKFSTCNLCIIYVHLNILIFETLMLKSQSFWRNFRTDFQTCPNHGWYKWYNNLASLTRKAEWYWYGKARCLFTTIFCSFIHEWL